MIDTHLHLYDSKYDDDREEIIRQINEEMEFIVNISCDYESSLVCIDYAENNEKMYATIGYHPCDISKFNEEKMVELLEKSKFNKKILAVGEIGLDYYWMNDDKETQKKYFKKQLEYAIKYNLPVVIHTRDALEDTLNILREYKEVKGILHCYPGSYEEVEDLLDRFYIGIGGTITFKNNIVGQELVKKINLDKIVLETDAPYLAPMPFRGKRNNPIYVKYVAEKIAQLKNIDIKEVLQKTSENAKKVYNV